MGFRDVYRMGFRDVRALLRDSTFLPVRHGATSWTKIEKELLRYELTYRTLHFTNAMSHQILCVRRSLARIRCFHISVSHPLQHFCGVGVTIFSLHIFSASMLVLDQCVS